MGGCCGGMKTGQKSLPDKKKSSSDVAAQEKSNGKKEALPATDAGGKTPTPDADAQQQQQEPIAASAKVSVDATEPVGSDNVMDLETAVAPYEGIISNATDQPQIQASVAADSELLLPYQIPVQHTFSSSTTTTTTTSSTTVRHQNVQLRVDEPQLNADFQDGGALSALATDLAFSPTGDVQVETVTKVTETVTTEAIPAVPELGASGTFEFGSTGASGETVEEPVAVVVKSPSHEVQRLPEEILPAGELEGSGLTGEARFGGEVSLTGFSGEEPEPILMVCPPAYPAPPIPDSHFIAVCPPAADTAVVFSGFDHQLSPDPGQVVVSESLSEGEQAPHAEFAIDEPSGLVRDTEQGLVETAEIQQQVVADLETAPDSAAESSSVPLQCTRVETSVELPEQLVGELLSTGFQTFEAQPSDLELRDQLEPEFATTSPPQQPEDFLPPLQQDQAAEPPSVVEGVADLSVTPSLPEESVKEIEIGVAVSSQLKQDQPTEPASYFQTEEPQFRHQEFGQEPYQEQQQHSEEEVTSYHAASGIESFEVVQNPVSGVIETVETRPVIESVSDEAHESRNTWWKEGGQPEAEGEIPVVETVSDQAQQSRQSWWEQSGSEQPSAPQQPDDLPSIPPPPPPPPPPPTSEVEEQAAAASPSIPAEIDAVSPSSDSFPEVIPEPLPSTFDQGTSGGGGGGATVESPQSSVDGSTLPTENGEVSVSSDEAFTPASVLSPEGSTPQGSNLSPDDVEPAAAAASSKEPISAQA